jgi:predicted DNA-binding mobile mystery protein A
MSDPKKRIRELARQQLDRRLDKIRSAAPHLMTPENGWVHTLRTCLAMSQEDLARRMSISRQAVSQLEQREVDGSVTLNALKEAAEALDGHLVYAIVPSRGTAATLEARALRLASRMTGSVHHTMRLEDQETESDLDERTRTLAKELLASPGQLWTASLDE